VGVRLGAYGTSVIREPSTRHAERALDVRAECVSQWVLAAPGVNVSHVISPNAFAVRAIIIIP
jgi:hypothetical protein